MNIDWADPNAKISQHFTVGEALFLNQWNTYHIPTEEEKAQILEHAGNMDIIRNFVGLPIIVHCWIRPILNNPSSPHNGEDYNALVGGARMSAHKFGRAVDFHFEGLDCDAARAKLQPMLNQWQVRMERNPGGPWVHIDNYDTEDQYRYFWP